MSDGDKTKPELLRELEVLRGLKRVRLDALLNAAIESLPFDFFAIDKDGYYVLQNSVCKKHGGDVLGKRPEDVAPDQATRELWMSNNRRAFAGEVVSEEATCNFGDGDRRLHNIVSPILVDGKVEGILGVNIDVTELARASEALRRERDFADALFNAPQDTVFLFDPETRRPLRWNAKFVAVSDYTDEEIGRMKIPDDFYGKEDLARAVEGISAVLESGQVTLELSLITKSGKAIPYEYSNTMVRNADGRPLILAIGRDLTERKRSEAERAQLRNELIHAQKMEAIGTLAAGIAHDFNNLLTGILGYSSLLIRQAPAGSPLFEGCDVIKKSAERAAELTKQLLGFARKGKLRDAAVDMHAAITSTIGIVEHTLEKGITVKRYLRADKSVVRGDAGQLEQMVMNLVLNASNAMTDGGELVVETADVELNEEYRRRQPEATTGPHLVMTISDTGTGIADEILPRIFDPFFTTKEMGKGTGMGLAMVYGIVRNHGGHVTVETQVGRGSIFRVYLPLMTAPSPDAEAAGVGDAKQGTGTILVVDDEEYVRRTAVAMLKQLGYQADSARDGKQALELCSDRRSKLDLVVLDLTMPKMDGRACFHQLKKIVPGVKVIISTGHALDRTSQELLDAGAVNFIPKPFTLEQLAEAVREALSC